MPEGYKPGTFVKPNPAVVAGYEDREYSVEEVAALFEVNILTVRAWCRSGQMKARKDTVSRRGGGWRISLEALQQFAIARYNK